jgi:flagellar export protein FliJ
LKFRFESILKLHQNLENQLQVELGKIGAHLHNQREQLQFMENIARERKQEMNQQMPGGLSANTFVLHGNFYAGVKLETKRQEKIISEVEEKFIAKRGEIIETMRKRRTMEILKERELIKHQKLQAKREIEELDESAAARWRMNS